MNHPLQAFNPKYFKPNSQRWFSFSEANLTAARQKHLEDRPAPPFISSLPAEDITVLDADRLQRFYDNPCRYLLNNRLDLYLDKRLDTIPDKEPFDLDPLNRYLYQVELLQQKVQQGDLNHIREKYLAKGLLPLSEAGILNSDRVIEEANMLFEKLEPYIEGKAPRPVPYDINIEGIQLKGTLNNVWNDQLIRVRPAKLRLRDRLNIWIEQLIYQIATGKPVTSVLIMKDPKTSRNTRKTITFACQEISDPAIQLERLLQYFKQGQTTPLPFFPQTTLAYLEALLKSSEEIAQKAAVKEWTGDGEYKTGEQENPYYKICYRHQHLFQTGFERIGQDVIRPLIEAQKKVS